MFGVRTILPRYGHLLNVIRKTEPHSVSALKILIAPLKQQLSIPAIPLTRQMDRFYATESKSNERIYYGSLAPRMKAVKIFSLTTSCAGLAAQPILMEQGMKLGGTGIAILLCSFAGFFTFVTPLMLHFITKKYVTEMHYNSVTGEYTATTISLFLRKIETKFRPSDVKVPEIPGIFTSFYVGKKPMFVDPALFENTEHYVRIMGYDKPIDFKLDLKDTNNTTTPHSSKTDDKGTPPK